MAADRYADLLDSIEAAQHSYSGSFEAALAVADALKRGRALDVPCGPGRMAEALSRLGFAAFGADLDAAGHRGRAPFCRLDLERGLPYAGSAFSFVYCGDGIEHLENPFLLLRELARVLADDGVLAVVTPNYLNVERRLKFLLTGSLARAPKRLPRYSEAPASTAATSTLSPSRGSPTSRRTQGSNSSSRAPSVPSTASAGWRRWRR